MQLACVYIHIDPLLWHTSLGCVHACGKYNGIRHQIWPCESKDTPCMRMRFPCYGLLAVGCVLTYYSHRCKKCKRVSMLDPTARIVKCTQS